ncbi:MAG: hypothetical protein CMJ95_10750 [Planctomycetes bacterium]|nr:hypothetical protein [Planctomycetota bacterium]
MDHNLFGSKLHTDFLGFSRLFDRRVLDSNNSCFKTPVCRHQKIKGSKQIFTHRIQSAISSAGMTFMNARSSSVCITLNPLPLLAILT